MVWRSGDGRRPSRGHRQIAAAVGQPAAVPATFHFVGNHSIDVAGDEATGEVYCEAHHLAAEGVDHVMFIRYRDRYPRRRSGGGSPSGDVRRGMESGRTCAGPAARLCTTRRRLSACQSV